MNIKFPTAILIFFLFLSSCTKIEIETPANLEVNDFIWKGLNKYYLWQKNVSHLSDVRFLNTSEYNSFLSTENNSYKFFNTLLHQKNIVDKWSWIVEDYVALEKSFQGISLHNGMEFGLVAINGNQTDLFGYVRYVLPNSDASAKNVKRGMVFNRINGTQITRNNYGSLLFSSSSYTLNLANYNGGDISSTNNSIDLTKTEYQENPVFITKTINSGSKKIGYIFYNSFTKTFDDELNAAFQTLKNEQITHLILDLRYNGGGSVKTAVYLSSMITGQFNKQLFAKKHFNNKLQSLFSKENLEENFVNKIDNGIVNENINSLQLSEIVIITTGSSASASELVINGLKPYINVKTIGTKTHGKYAGSVTLYDSPNFLKNKINENHNWAIQPIVLEIKNKLNINNKQGFEPNILLPEDYGNLGEIGKLTDPLLNSAIRYITTGSKGQSYSKGLVTTDEYSNSKQALPLKNNMYIDLKH
jgi:C-terminal processing protease CtpA/Prc